MMQIDVFFKQFIDEKGLSRETKYVSSFHFELTEYWANELLRLVLIGQKRATASSYLSYEITNEPLPNIGDYHIITDFSGVPYCVIQTTGVMIVPYKELTYHIVKREGEDENLASWQKGHEKFFTAEGKELGYTFHPDMLVVFEDFEVVYQKKDVS